MSALTLPGFDVLPPERLRQRALSQWFTPAALAERLVRWAGPLRRETHILEPACGSGAVLSAILARHAGARVDAVEIDPRFADEARAAAGSGAVSVDCADYLARPAPAEPYSLAIMNPPYEDGLDGAFIAKAMDECERVIALCRLNVITGKARHERVWSRVGTGEWWLVGLAVLVGRPSFSAAGAESESPLSDFVAIKLSRRESYDARGTQVEWWG